MPTELQETDLRLMIKVGFLYYEHEYKQSEIAERLHLSRPKVSRLLRKARDQGIVQISVVPPGDDHVELETALEEQFGIDEALVVGATPGSTATDGANGNSVTNEAFLKRQIGRGAARYLRRSIEENDVLGITWGTTLQAMVESMHKTPVEGVRVVQTLGGVGPPEAEAHAADLSRQLAHLLEARLTPLPAPGIVGSREAREVMFSDQHVQAALERFSQITTAYVGIGALSTNPIFSDDPAVSPDAREKLDRAGAVGDIAMRFFDVEGHVTHASFEEGIIGITLEQLSTVERVVGVAGGNEKTQAIRGALCGGLIDVLITDHSTASRLV